MTKDNCWSEQIPEKSTVLFFGATRYNSLMPHLFQCSNQQNCPYLSFGFSQEWTKTRQQNESSLLEAKNCMIIHLQKEKKNIYHWSLYKIQALRSIYNILRLCFEVLTGMVTFSIPFSTSTAGTGTGTWTATPGTGHSWPALLGGANLRTDGSFLAFCKIYQMYM